MYRKESFPKMKKKFNTLNCCQFFSQLFEEFTTFTVVVSFRGIQNHIHYCTLLRIQSVVVSDLISA
jgi:hypothetical protein